MAASQQRTQRRPLAARVHERAERHGHELVGPGITGRQERPQPQGPVGQHRRGDLGWQGDRGPTGVPSPEGREEDVLLAPHHALRPSRRSARIEDVVVVGEPAARSRRWPTIPPRAPRTHRPSAAASPRSAAGVRSGEVDHADRLRVVEHVRQLRLDVAVVDVDRNGAELVARQQRLDMLGAVVEIDGDVIAGPHAEPGQTMGQPGRPLLQARVGEPGLAGDERQARSHHARHAFPQVGEVELHGARSWPTAIRSGSTCSTCGCTPTVSSPRSGTRPAPSTTSRWSGSGPGSGRWRAGRRRSPQPGDYVEYSIGDQSILVVRAGPDEIVALPQHLPAPGHPAGRRARHHSPTATIRCRYHAWCYDLDGAPDRRRRPGGVRAVCLPGSASRPSAPTAGVASCGSTSTGDAEPLARLPRPADRRCWPRTTSSGCGFRAYRSTILPANWKVVVDAFNEGYHVQGTAPADPAVDRRRQHRVRAVRDPRPLRPAARSPRGSCDRAHGSGCRRASTTRARSWPRWSPASAACSSATSETLVAELRARVRHLGEDLLAGVPGAARRQLLEAAGFDVHGSPTTN